MTAPRTPDETDSFPNIEEVTTNTAHGGISPARTRTRESSNASGRLRGASIRFLESAPPLGFLQATGEAAAKAPTLSDIRRGSYTNPETQSEWRRRGSSTSASISPQWTRLSPSGLAGRDHEVAEQQDEATLDTIPSSNFGGDNAKANRVLGKDQIDPQSKTVPATTSKERGSADTPPLPTKSEFPTGYQFPPKHTWGQATVIGLKAFWKFFLTPFGFLIVLYGVNVVAWGGMLFLLFIGGGKALCHPNCGDINSPRRKWIEIDSQILNALFCVTGFGLIPWRFRDLYYLLRFRIQKDFNGLRRLAGYNKGWFRLAGSERIPVPALVRDNDILDDVPSESIPIPESSTPDPPLTGIRAPPTKVWKLDFVIWMYVLNTFLQAILSGFMWGFNRRTRPSWSTGLFVGLACSVAAAGGLMSFIEGNHVKKIEGVPWVVDDKILDAEKGVGITEERKAAEAEADAIGITPKEKRRWFKTHEEKVVV
jgi:hypothetical protein